MIFSHAFEQEPIGTEGAYIISISGASVLFALFLLTGTYNLIFNLPQGSFGIFMAVYTFISLALVLVNEE